MQGLKRRDPVSKRNRGPLIAQPDVQEVELSPADEFIVMACDGLWDVFPPSTASADVIKFVRSRLVDHNDPQRCSQVRLVHGGSAHHSLAVLSDITCIIILFSVIVTSILCQWMIADRNHLSDRTVFLFAPCPFQELVNFALQRHAADNVTAVIVCFSEQTLSPLSPQIFRNSMLRKSASSTSLRVP